MESARVDNRMVVTMLGSGTSAGVPMIGCHCAVCTSADARDKRMRPSILVSYAGHNILVDTSPELRLQAVREGIDRISAVVYTHAHADHIFGLDDVRRYNTLMQGALPVYATAETMQRLRDSFPYAFLPPVKPDAPKNDAIFRPELAPREISGPFELCGRRWTPVELLHGRTKVLGFRIGDFAYCTDCNEIAPGSRALLQGLDVLIIDGLRPRPHPTHLSFDEALGIIDELKPRRAFFTHLSHDVKHEELERTLPAQVRVGYDGLKIETD
jgi:phosphoribosyl 1,2-cyclic phosphate phosphodiesterase